MCTCANPSAAAARSGPSRTTVRQVKRLSRDRKSVSDPLLETLLYPPWVTGLTKPVPPPKPAKSPQNYQQAPGPPPYRMPPYPLYNESTPLPGSSNKIHTHSSKFPIEREVVLSNVDKNLKIPILNEYKKRPKSVAPDTPNVQIAWSEQSSNVNNVPQNNHQYHTPHHYTMIKDNVNQQYVYKAEPIKPLDPPTELSPIFRDDSNGFPQRVDTYIAGPSHSTPEDPNNSKKFSSRIKDMITTRFSKSKNEQVSETNLNNAEVPMPTPVKLDDPALSPHSQLIQHGVYLAVNNQMQNLAISVPNQNVYQTPDQCRTNPGPSRTYDRPHTIQTNRVIDMRKPDPSTYSDVNRNNYEVRVQSNYGQINQSPLYVKKRLSVPTQPQDCFKTPLPVKCQDTPVPFSRSKSNDNLVEQTGQTNVQYSSDRYLARKISKRDDFKSQPSSLDDVDKLEEQRAASGPISGASSDGRLGSGGQSDSGRGSTVYSSGKAQNSATSPESSSELQTNQGKKGQSEWMDYVDTELRQILDPSKVSVPSTLSDSVSSVTPPLPPLSPDGSSDDMQTPVHKLRTEYSVKSRGQSSNQRTPWSNRAPKEKSHRQTSTNKRPDLKRILQSSSVGDMDSMFDEEASSDDETVNSDVRTIRKQLEGLETMYSEVLKLLGVRKSGGGPRYQPSDPRVNRRRMYGSMSSIPSSVSSRPYRERHRRSTDDRKKSVKDIKGINKRFQRLESHVVTLARSVAHLSSEMRTQHLMIQEMEVIRNELSALRTQTNMLSIRSHSVPRVLQSLCPEQTNSSPNKVKKLTKFFGDEPPLLRLFLKKLGYEKYASAFEKEKIGLVELPYMSEERMHKLGVPMGPRLRIMQEAQLGFPGMHENTLAIV
ncbi:uncharacterized protein LOC132921236 isoform X1 [Rhopalosiphum padi]|uniref:uncharacterized protein LOC132921236 isoform X1 n=2 Tax=Rhopalosiphum padi TaxID=40932 RepID=UPI00298D7CED|nr:uncharacterized protein LOC132921236 isoform X1 [Rhopalosiphum padi]